ncbi:hypothetical protein, partial [Mycobacterium avium]
MARATDITGVTRRRVGVRIDPGDPLRPATSAALAIAPNSMRATRCARRQRRACDRTEPDEGDPLRPATSAALAI